MNPTFSDLTGWTPADLRPPTHDRDADQLLA